MRDKLLQLGINTYKWMARYYTFPPLQVKVETTKSCNLRCIGCRRNFEETLSKSPGPIHLTVEALGNILAGASVRAVAFEGDGEPLCNPYFKALLEYCKKKGIRSGFSTNATLIDENWVKLFEKFGVMRVHVSVDGSNKELFEKTRLGADFDQVVYACKLIGKSKVQLFLNYVPSSAEIIEDLPNYVDLAKRVGATGILPLKFQSDGKGLGNPPDWTLFPNVLEYVKHKAKRKGLILVSSCSTEPKFMECENPYINPYIILGGDVYACSYMANLRTSEVYMGRVIPIESKNYCMGSVNVQPLETIWRNKAFREIRTFLRSTRRPTGTQISREALLEMKLKPKGRFGYCRGCLCRWSESGL